MSFESADKFGHQPNIFVKFFPLEIFQFCNGFKSDKNIHSQNINEKSFTLETFQFCNGLKSHNEKHL